ncbi:fused MFS/spermidine synthase [Breoghania sp. L-A4]|uniref:fused MFS/spermidine synthase n=1 Tax=Breoghania sp. L-A4 TaxID=2304600 RepID=UPI0013C329E5|nr:fused MFS/spermidine synthase [Breoghania sp. L-A4]
MSAALLAVAVALNAAGAMIVEIVAGRLLAPYFGMSLYTWTTVIGVVLAGLTCGHWIGGRLAGRYRAHLAPVIGLSFWLGALTTVLVLPVTGLVAGALLRGEAAPALAIALSGLAGFFIPSLVAGLVQPMATVFELQRAAAHSGPVVGRMLAAGAFGSILGTFIAGFVLISWLGSAGTIWLVAGLNAVLGALFLPGLSRRGGALAAAGLLVPLAVISGGVTVPGFATPCQVESRYYCIRIDPADGQTGRASRLMALDHLVHSVNDEADPQALFSPYLHLVDEIARHRFADEPISAFFIGGGGFTLPRAWQARNPASDLTIAEIDPVVTRLAREKLWFAPGENTHVLERDARVALRAIPEAPRFDVVFGDAFHDIAIPAHLISDEFNALVARRLKDTGFYVLNVVDDPSNPRLLASLLRTLKLRFPLLEVWVEPRDIQGARRATFIVYAAKQPSGLEATHRATYGYRHLWLRVDPASIDIDGLGITLTDDFAPVDRLLSGLWLGGD